MNIRLLPLELLLLSVEVRLLPLETLRGIPASMLIAPKLLADRAECAEWTDAELPPVLLI
jgi:hypothetical protein